jgi:hypothetical protein
MFFSILSLDYSDYGLHCSFADYFYTGEWLYLDIAKDGLWIALQSNLPEGPFDIQWRILIYLTYSVVLSRDDGPSKLWERRTGNGGMWGGVPPPSPIRRKSGM